MSTLTPEQIKTIIAKASPGQSITVRARRVQSTQVVEIKGIVQEIPKDEGTLVIRPLGRSDATADLKIPQHDAEYLDISLAGEKKYASIFEFAGTSLANDYGIVEYDPSTYISAISKGIQVPQILAGLDAYFEMTDRRYFSGSQDVGEEEKAHCRDSIKHFLQHACQFEVTEYTLPWVWDPVIRLCGIRRTKGLRGEVRAKTMARAYAIRALTDAKEREKLWTDYNMAAFGTPFN